MNISAYRADYLPLLGQLMNQMNLPKIINETVRTYAFETSFSISVDVFCIVYSILTNIRYADIDYLHSNA